MGDVGWDVDIKMVIDIWLWTPTYINKYLGRYTK